MEEGELTEPSWTKKSGQQQELYTVSLALIAFAVTLVMYCQWIQREGKYENWSIVLQLISSLDLQVYQNDWSHITRNCHSTAFIAWNWIAPKGQLNRVQWDVSDCGMNLSIIGHVLQEGFCPGRTECGRVTQGWEAHDCAKGNITYGTKRGWEQKALIRTQLIQVDGIADSEACNPMANRSHYFLWTENAGEKLLRTSRDILVHKVQHGHYVAKYRGNHL